MFKKLIKEMQPTSVSLPREYHGAEKRSGGLQSMGSQNNQTQLSRLTHKAIQPVESKAGISIQEA